MVYDGAHIVLHLEYVRADGVALTIIVEDSRKEGSRYERFANGALMMAYKEQNDASVKH